MAINLLDTHTAELIAAGEVVERPASVVKELMENAIDAGATSVTVEIEKGGIALIRVTDNGGGILAEDLPLAFVRHATSKVRTKDDLDAIGTLGFRGEALASIASVSRTELLSWNKADEGASLVLIEGGSQRPAEDAARGEGTTITVRDLFYNTPARMKFLKKDTSEGGFVTETVTRIALSHPEVAVRYRREGKPVFETPGSGNLRDTAYAVLGAEFARGLLEINGEEPPLAVNGLITKPGAGRASRSMQFFFINGRFVKNRTMMAALEQAYRGMSMVGKFPGGIVFLEMPPQLVDVNVHPAKTEVRFAREQDVFQAVYRAAKNALMGSAATHQSFEIPSSGEKQTGAAEATAETRAASRPKTVGAVKSTPQQVKAYNEMVRQSTEAGDVLSSPVNAVVYETRPKPPPFFAEKPAPPRDYGLDILHEADVPQKIEIQQTRPVTAITPAADAAGTKIEARADLEAEPEQVQHPVQQQIAGTEAPQGTRLRFVGEVFNTYIIAETGADEFCMIDKHAAHERILYEEVAAKRGGAGAQQLLSPVSVALGAEEKNALLQNSKVLEDAGIEIDDFGGNAVLVRAVPADVGHADAAALAEEVAGRLCLNQKDSMDEKTEWVLHSIACRAAIKAGDKTPPQQLIKLAEDILNGEVPPFCPHGRPVVLKISRKELEKQFGRLG